MDELDEKKPIDEVLLEMDDSVRDVHEEMRLEMDDSVVDNIWPIEPTKTVIRTNLQDLNDNCLLEIFSINSLTVMDLCSLAETCKRFKPLTERVFPKDFRVTSWSNRTSENREYEFRSKNMEATYIGLPDVERVLKNFGSYIAKLYTENDQNVVNLVTKYCVDVTLKTLKLEHMNSVEGIGLQRLQKLSLIFCDFNCTSLDINCDSLIELEFRVSSGCAVILEQTFPNLERFTFDRSNVSVTKDNSSDALIKFIERHKRLRTLYLGGSSVHFNSTFVHMITSCEELEELSLRDLNMGTVDLSNLQSPEKLTKLNLWENSVDSKYFIVLLRALTSVESVTLQIPTKMSSDFFGALLQMQHLRDLSLNLFGIESPQGFTILPQLHNLGTLSLVCDRAENSKEGLDFLTKMQSLRELYLHFDYFPSIEVFEILSKMLHLNTLWLSCWHPIKIPWQMLTQLRKLCLSNIEEEEPSIGATELVNIVKQLTHLEEIEFQHTLDNESFIIMNTEEYFEIVKIAEQRASVLTLKGRFKFSENCAENRYVKFIKVFKN